MEKTEEAFHCIHDKLSDLPMPYCKWKKRGADGRIISKSISSDYLPIFYFIKDSDLRHSLAELRMCFDYHHSLFKLHKPGLTFGWQHKLVLCQIMAGIYEGIMLDLFDAMITSNENHLSFVIGKQKLENKSFGFGGLIDIFYKSKIIDSKWQDYLINLNHIRNTIHPKYLKSEKISFQKNPAIANSIDNLILNFEIFRKMIIKHYSF